MEMANSMPIGIAGFSNARAANGIHDELWARAMVIDDGPTRIAMVSLDAIGFFLDNDTLHTPGLGGIAVYINGAIGGLMTTNPQFAIPDPFADTLYTAPSLQKAKAQGQHLALRSLKALTSEKPQPATQEPKAMDLIPS
jgi:hypothetical protein